MSEWLKEHAWKACVGETLPRVRIPLSPPTFAHACRRHRELRLASHAKVVRRSAKRGGGPPLAPPHVRSYSLRRLLEQDLQRPLHGAGAALCNDGVPGVDVWRRTDRPERAAAHVGADRRAEVDAIQEIEDFPSRLDARVRARGERFDEIQVPLC